MKEPYIAQEGVPIPETRGRTKGSADLNNAARQEAIAKGVALVMSGLSYTEAANMVLVAYPGVTKERMARLIRQSTKDSSLT